MRTTRMPRRDVPTEQQCVRIRVIDVHDALGYHGVGREEHSGENSPDEEDDLFAELADNLPEQIGRDH